MSDRERGPKVQDVSALRRVMLDPSSGSSGRSFNAVAELQAIGDPQAVSALIEGVRAADPYVAGRAAQALGQLGASEAVPALVRELEDRGDEMEGHERHAFQLAVVGLIERLHKAGDDEAISVLVGLVDVNSLPVARRAAQALAEMQAREAVPALIRVLEVRGSALPVNAQLTFIRALREMPHASSVGVLAEALYRDGVREYAAAALVELRTPEATAALEAAAAELGWSKGRQVRRAVRLKKAQGLE